MSNKNKKDLLLKTGVYQVSNIDIEIKNKMDKFLKKKKPESYIKHFNLLISAFNLIMNTEELEDFLMKLNEDEANYLYSHPILDYYDLLP